MEDCLEMVDALNALLSPGERELCEELMSSCEVTDFRCFHCPTRCDAELEMIRHCDQAHPYYEAKYHLPSNFGPAISTLMNDECRWVCCVCSMLTSTRQEMENHCITYHRNSTSRHFFIDRTGLLKMSFTDRSFLPQPPLAPTPPQDSSDILFHDLASSEGELEKLNLQATQMAVMALTSPGNQSAGLAVLPPISSLLHPESSIQDSQIGYTRQDLYYSTSSSINLCYQPPNDGETSDLGSSPSSSTYSDASPVDFNQYGTQPIDRCTYSYASFPKYSAMSFDDIIPLEPARTKIEERNASSEGTRCYNESSNILSSVRTHLNNQAQPSNESSVPFISTNMLMDGTIKAGDSKSERQSRLVKKVSVKRSKTAKARLQPSYQNTSLSSEAICISTGVDNSPVQQRSVGFAAAAKNKPITRKGRAATLLNLAGPLSAKRKRLRAALEHVAAPASVKMALEKINIELHLAVLPAVCSGSSRSVQDLEILLEEHLKSHERAFIHIAGCKLKVRDYASVVDIHPTIQLTDVLRTGIK